MHFFHLASSVVLACRKLHRVAPARSCSGPIRSYGQGNLGWVEGLELIVRREQRARSWAGAREILFEFRHAQGCAVCNSSHDQLSIKSWECVPVKGVVHRAQATPARYHLFMPVVQSRECLASVSCHVLFMLWYA